MLKAGWKTSEFWLSVCSILATAGVAILEKLPEQLGQFSTIAGAIAKFIVPIVSAWVVANFIKSRTTIKVAAIAAGAEAGKTDPATVLNK